MSDFILIFVLGFANGLGWGLGAPESWRTWRTVLVSSCCYAVLICLVYLVRG